MKLMKKLYLYACKNYGENDDRGEHKGNKKFLGVTNQDQILLYNPWGTSENGILKWFEKTFSKKFGLHSNKKVSYPNLTKKEKQTAYCLKDSGTVMWDIEDYLAEVRPSLEDNKVY